MSKRRGVSFLELAKAQRGGTPGRGQRTGERTEHPEAWAVLDVGPGCWLWIVPDCPLCGDRHVHGGGDVIGDPRELLGHRTAHCLEGSPGDGYVLVAVFRTNAAMDLDEAFRWGWVPAVVEMGR